MLVKCRFPRDKIVFHLQRYIATIPFHVMENQRLEVNSYK